MDKLDADPLLLWGLHGLCRTYTGGIYASVSAQSVETLAVIEIIFQPSWNSISDHESLIQGQGVIQGYGGGGGRGGRGIIPPPQISKLSSTKIEIKQFY